MIGRFVRPAFRMALLVLTLLLGALAEGRGAAARIAMLSDNLPGADPTANAAVAESLRRAGFEVDNLSADAACDPAVLSVKKYFLYVIPGVKGYPGAGTAALTQFLQAKGHLLVLGGSPFGGVLWKHDGKWVDLDFVRKAVAQVKPARISHDFDRPSQAHGWTRSGNRERGASAEVVPKGADGSAGCLKMTISFLSGSPDGWGGPLPKNSDIAGRGLLCFWAKGDGQTAQISVRLIEGPKPEQRGIAVIRITKNWAYYVLRPEDFRKIGQADPGKATRVCFELIDRQVNPLVAEGRHTFYVDQIGVAPDPFPAAGDLKSTPFPLIETLSPGYKVFPLSDIAAIKVRGDQDIVEAGMRLPAPTQLFSCYRRPEGKGFERGYRWRWIPLVQALDAAGQERGTPVWMLVNQAPLNEGPDFEDAVRRLATREPERHLHQPSPAEGSICAACAVADPAALKAIAQTNLLGTLAQRMREGLFLSHAGSQQFSYWPGEDVRLGAVAANYGAAPAKVAVRIRVCPATGGEPLFERQAALTLAPGQKGAINFDWPAPQFRQERYTVTTELLRDGQPIDRIVHELGVLSTKTPARDEFITVKDGEFWLRGKKWNPIGVNYWPRSTIALEPLDYTYHWLTPGYYDPEQIEQELAQLESIGANLVCIRAHHQNDRRTLLDFLRRSKNHSIYALLFPQSHVITDDPHYFQGLLMPTHFQEAAVAEFIRETRLVDNAQIFAYDTIWEPAGWMFGDKMGFGWKDPAPYRQRWDADWARWIDDRYGSLAQAEADWGMPAPRRGDAVTSPPNEQFRNDGPWRVMVAAYRRFMDDLMSRKWNDATRTLRRLDPNHMITFRQGNLPPLDFTLSATPKHVDFFAMEGYDLRPGDVGPNAAGFINRYLRFATRGKPFLWVEFGQTAWDGVVMQPTEAAIQAQAATSEVVYRAALENGANGASPWWWAGGYRVSEQSDYGVTNPDGTLRPSGELLRDYGRRFRAQQGYPEADAWYTFDRDAHAGAVWRAAFNEGAAAFAAARAAGKKLGIRTPATGTTSVDTPLVAVGNRPYNGHNPPKYLDAEFNWFKIRIGDGPWIDVAPNAKISVPANIPILAAASVGNIQEAAWLTPASAAGKPGAVYLASTEKSSLKLRQPIAKNTVWQADAEFGPSFPLSAGISATTPVELQMSAEGRARFGEKLRFMLVPKAAVK